MATAAPRLAFLLVGFALFGLWATAANAAEDEGEILDVSKTVSGLEKKLGELHERGRWAREGKLSAAAVCGDQTPSTVFSSFGDSALYVPTPEGDLETTEHWTLNKHARRAENSPFGPGQSSLFLPDKGEAISPAFCVGTAYPTIRVFTANTGDEDSRLDVEVLYEGVDGKVKKLKIAKLRGTRDWGPSAIVPIHVNLLGAASEDGFTAVALKFKAKDVKSEDGGWKLDDLFVDPWVSGW